MSKEPENQIETTTKQMEVKGGLLDSPNSQGLKAFGTRLRQVREMMSEEERRTQQGFANLLKISPGYLSQIETGKKPVSIDFVLDVARIAKLSPALLFTTEPHLERPVAGFDDAIKFLQKAADYGIVAIDRKREDALYRLAQFIQPLTKFSVHITGSSLQGLQQDSDCDFVASLQEKKERLSASIQIEVLFTFLPFAFAREDLEERSPGSIVFEVAQGILWALKKWNLKKQNIKFLRTAPTTFSIFVTADREDGGTIGIGLINPYPVMAQAFQSTSLVIQKSGAKDGTRQSQAMFESLLLSNFRRPWGGKLSVDLDSGLRECLEGKSDAVKNLTDQQQDILRQHATKLQDDLKKLE